MSWFKALPLEFEAKQWPHMGLPDLLEFVGPDNVIVARDGTVYVIVGTGHPQRVEPGWSVCRYPAGEIVVSSGTIPSMWEKIPDPERQQ